MEILGSARRHGITDDDILHAIGHAMIEADLDDDKVLYLGPDRAAKVLEVVTVRRVGREPLVIHAMRMRKRYEPYLRGQEDQNA